MRKTTNENKSNRYLMIALSLICVLLIGISFLGEGLISPVKQVSGFVITPIQKGINGLGLRIILRMPFPCGKRTRS